MTFVAPGYSVKALGDGKVGGYLVRFSTEQDPDLARDYFTSKTDFDIFDGAKSAVYYDHGLDGVVGKRKLADGQLSVTDQGVWIEAQLALRDEYERAIYQLAMAGKLGWSSGTAAHLVERSETGSSFHIDRWPLGLDASLTPTPCEPRTIAVPVKTRHTLSEMILDHNLQSVIRIEQMRIESDLTETLYGEKP